MAFKRNIAFDPGGRGTPSDRCVVLSVKREETDEKLVPCFLIGKCPVTGVHEGFTKVNSYCATHSTLNTASWDKPQRGEEGLDPIEMTEAQALDGVGKRKRNAIMGAFSMDMRCGGAGGSREWTARVTADRCRAHHVGCEWARPWQRARSDRTADVWNSPCRTRLSALLPLHSRFAAFWECSKLMTVKPASIPHP